MCWCLHCGTATVNFASIVHGCPTHSDWRLLLLPSLVSGRNSYMYLITLIDPSVITIHCNMYHVNPSSQAAIILSIRSIKSYHRMIACASYQVLQSNHPHYDAAENSFPCHLHRIDRINHQSIDRNPTCRSTCSSSLNTCSFTDNVYR